MSIETVIGRIDRVTRECAENFGALPAGALNWKADAASWSIAQNLEHLILVNESYYPVIESIRNQSYRVPATGRVNFLVELFGKFILKGVSPDNTRKVSTFPVWEPSQSAVGKDIVKKFEAHQEELKRLVTSSIDLIEDRRVISSPANKYIVYRIDKAVDIIVTHEERHLKQARDVLALLPQT